MFFGPSRFLWFSFGSLATYAWLHYHKGDNLNCRRTAQVGYDGSNGDGQWGPQRWRARFDEQRQQQQQQWGSRGSANDSHLGANAGQREPSPAVAEASGRLPADRDFDRLREVGRNAEETISGMSEATIDSMMGGLQRLKDRLAERRSQQLQDPQQPLAATNPSPTPSEKPTLPYHQV